MKKIKRLLHRIEKRIRYKWHRDPIATEKIMTSEVVGLRRGFWGQLYAHPAVQCRSEIIIGIAAKQVIENEPYPLWDILTHGEITGITAANLDVKQVKGE